MSVSRLARRTLPLFNSPPLLPRPPLPSQPRLLPLVRARQKHRYRRFGDPKPRHNQSTAFFERWAASPYFYAQVGGLGLGASAVYIYNLETVPVTGRRRFNIMSSETEKAVGIQAYHDLLQEYRGMILPQYDSRHQLVQRVLDRLVPSAGLEAGEMWEVHVIDEPEQINAFVVPGGKVFVFTGILPICETEDGVAAVLGHEIAHNVAHHRAERMSQASVLPVAVAFTSAALGAPEWAINLLYRFGFQMPNSRMQESEADFMGLLIMAQSCYDPSSAVGVWQRMQQAEEFSRPQFLSTHPTSKNRETQIQEWLPQAMDKFNASECGSTSYWGNQFRSQFPSESESFW